VQPHCEGSNAIQTVAMALNLRDYDRRWSRDDKGGGCVRKDSSKSAIPAPLQMVLPKFGTQSGSCRAAKPYHQKTAQ
jgi:hypothetical protein